MKIQHVACSYEKQMQRSEVQVKKKRRKKEEEKRNQMNE
jgi:hypothetical protein